MDLPCRSTVTCANIAVAPATLRSLIDRMQRESDVCLWRVCLLCARPRAPEFCGTATRLREQYKASKVKAPSPPPLCFPHPRSVENPTVWKERQEEAHTAHGFLFVDVCDASSAFLFFIYIICSLDRVCSVEALGGRCRHRRVIGEFSSSGYSKAKQTNDSGTMATNGFVVSTARAGWRRILF